VNTLSKHILVIRLSAMGDVAMSVPILRAFVKQNPTIKVTVLSKAFFRPLFENIENVDFFAADVTGKHKGIIGLYRLYKELKLLNVDAIVDLHNVLRSKILRFFFGTLSRINTAVIDKGRAEKKALTRIHNKVFKQLKTSHERYADVFRKLGFSINLASPKFADKENLSEEIIRISKTDHLKWIGIAPFAQYQSKMYPLDLIEEVIEKLSSTKQYKIFLFGGGENEITTLNEVSSKFKNTLNVAGEMKLKDELNLISHLDCMVSMDSANSHLAAMQGIKTITIWGITHPYAGFAPFNQPHKNMILPDLSNYPNIPCSIYGNKVCEGYEKIMDSISPEKVVKKIVEIIN
jgi:ADP-heptose:LPS heptosyltransferase